MWAPDVPPVDPRTALRYFGIAVLAFGGIMSAAYLGGPEMPAIRREYPYDGLVKELGSVEANKVYCLMVAR
jgi:NADH dehydrogenase (ubiquinone) 1 beta subcomplex subunit 8